MNLWINAKAENGGDRVAAAIEIARGLSAHDPSDPLRSPYTPENAVLAVCDLAATHNDTLTTEERERVTDALGERR